MTEELEGDSYATQISGDQGGDIVYVHAADDAAADRFVSWFRERSGNPVEVIGRTPGTALFRGKNSPTGVTMTLLRSGCTILWPAVWRDGLEYYTVVAGDRNILRRTIENVGKLGEVVVEAVSDVAVDSLEMKIPLASFTADLTGRQLDVLLRAIAGGYYESPRKAKAEDLAKRLGVSRSTFEEHLRKAEVRILGRVGALLKSHTGLATATRGRGRPAKIVPTARP